jgi:hypothetical protein
MNSAVLESPWGGEHLGQGEGCGCVEVRVCVGGGVRGCRGAGRARVRGRIQGHALRSL